MMDDAVPYGSLVLSLVGGFMLFGLFWLLEPFLSSRNDDETVMQLKRSQRNGRAVDDGKERHVCLSVVVLTRNEMETLAVEMDEIVQILLERAHVETRFSFELIVVDNSSTDDTREAMQRVLETCAGSDVAACYVRSKYVDGTGHAALKGVMQASGDYVLLMEAGANVPIKELSRLEECMKTVENKAGDGVVIGSHAHILLSRSFGNSSSYLHRVLFQLLCVEDVYDSLCSFKLFTGQSARRLFSNMHLRSDGYQNELIYLAKKMAIPLKETAVECLQPQQMLASRESRAYPTLIRDLVVMRAAYLFRLWKPKIQ